MFAALRRLYDSLPSAIGGGIRLRLLFLTVGFSWRLSKRRD